MRKSEGGRPKADNRVKNRNASPALALSSSTLGPEPGQGLGSARWQRGHAPPRLPDLVTGAGGGASAGDVTARPTAAVGVFADAQAPPPPSLFPSLP